MPRRDPGPPEPLHELAAVRAGMMETPSGRYQSGQGLIFGGTQRKKSDVLKAVAFPTTAHP